MKAFRFTLQQVLQLRENEVKLEESKLELLWTQHRQFEAEREALNASLERSTQAVKGQRVLQMFELVALDRYKERVKREQLQWAERLRRQAVLIEKQHARVVAARGRVKLLEKLREKRKDAWQMEVNRELEELTSDFSAAQWLRERER